MTTWDIVVLAVYLLIVFSVGLAFTRRAHQNTDQYFLSGRNLPWWVAGTSIVATSFSCDTPLYVTKLVRTGGVALNWQWWSFAIGSLFSAFFLARLWRRARVVTDIELTELRYGGRAGRTLRTVRAAWFALLLNTYGMSWVVLAMAKIIGVVWGGDKMTGVLIASTLAVVYSFFAGFWGVVVTDVAQFIVAIIGAALFAVFAIDAAGGIESIMATVGRDTMTMLPTIPEAGLFSVDTWTGVFGGFIVYLSVFWWANQNSDGGGKAIQRMLATKNEAHAFGATLWFNIAHFALRSWPWILVGLASLVLLPEAPQGDDELTYPILILTVLPEGLRGLLVAGLVAAFMSTIDTQLNWGASYLTHDIYRTRIAPGRTEKHYLWAAKVSMLVLIVLTSLIAYQMQSVTTAFQFLLAFGAGTGPVYVLRWFWWRVGAWTEISAMIASTILSTLLYLLTPDMAYHLKLLIIVGGSMMIFLPVTFLVGSPTLETLMAFYKRTRPPGLWGPVRQALLEEGYTEIEPGQFRGDLLGWLAGTAMTLGLTFTIGSFALQLWTRGAVWSAVMFAGGYGVYRWFRLRFPNV
ncbi:sodium:proline symporter [bacterium]|nr:sodium:proline symporter [bacterium]